ncbi:stage II sporulation protein R [Cellulosilyticum ruminicola]|uniref:stage II sporulation protein R n=1 Tax=Cellulosilyticum ruminicola TaxID=425254 RepID=UPI0006D28031|nr:stage II sporulation protein R [Cellulosilyticum ruminicola]
MSKLDELLRYKKYNSRLVYTVTLIIAVVVCVGLGIITIYANGVSQDLAQNMLRFHVVANSDSTEDQLLKQQVKDEIIAYMEPLLKKSKNIEESKVIIREHEDSIQNVAEHVVYRWGKDYKVQVFLDKANFPTKAYGDIVLPAGQYEACRVIIGEGKGQNWWCIMFPPLCYVDAAKGVVPMEGKEELQDQLTPEQYKLISRSEVHYEVRFKIVDTVNSYLHKEDYKDCNEH